MACNNLTTPATKQSQTHQHLYPHFTGGLDVLYSSLAFLPLNKTMASSTAICWVGLVCSLTICPDSVQQWSYFVQFIYFGPGKLRHPGSVIQMQMTQI